MISFLIVREMIRLTASRGILLDRPNERSSHATPTPRGGGLAIALVVLVGTGLLWRPDGVMGWRGIVAFLLGAGLIAVVGWIDDLRSLGSLTRLLVHIVGALAIVGLVGYWRAVEIPVLGGLGLGEFGIPLSLVWITASTNIYNFMDGIDGLAGSQAICAGIGWLIVGLASGQDPIVWLSILLISSALGFLLHNWPPARIFMGDVASGFLGFAFGSMAVMGAQYDARYAVAGILFIWPFVFDGSYTILRRLRNRENVFTAHRSHLYQRLVASGLSHRTVTIMYASGALVCVAATWVWLFRPGADLVPVGTALLTAVGPLWLVRSRETARVTIDTISQMQAKEG